jgi:nucleolar protein 9
MPKEGKKRGRREELKKRKRDHDEPDESTKRHKHADDEASHVPAVEEPPCQDQAVGGVIAPGPPLYSGMLDEDEQEYFKRADELLELNQFGDAEERSLFLENVYREAAGKELKIASSQSCSRLMERLILLSTPAQLKDLFKAFETQ